ncbi:MAG: hypothetical protein GY856_00175 [bacterium]|nr:hypothetical protein [bacterium]
MSRPQDKSIEYFESLRRRGHKEVDQGRLDEALATYDEALEWAECHGDQRTVDLAFCNRAAVLVAQGDGRRMVGPLRCILLRQSDSTVRHLAAYNVSLFYESANDHQKGLFYARLSLDHANSTGDSEFIGRSHNRIGNALIAQSYFEQAQASYLQALELVGEEPSPVRVANLDNIGYCHIVMGNYEAGFGALFRSLRLLRKLKLFQWESDIRNDLCYAYLEIDRLDHARRHGLAALVAAEKRGKYEQVKNSLYLLGEAAKLAGESLSAYSYFSRLRDEFYPEKQFIADMLMTVDTRQLVNLRAL